MTTLRETAKMALEAMRCAVPTGKITLYAWDKAMANLRTALAEPDWQDLYLKEKKRADMWREKYESVAGAEQRIHPLAEPVHEPVVWIQPDHLQKARVAPYLCRVEPTQRCSDFIALYSAPPQRKPLTREEAIALWADKSDGPSNSEIVLYCRAIERAHGIT